MCENCGNSDCKGMPELASRAITFFANDGDLMEKWSIPKELAARDRVPDDDLGMRFYLAMKHFRDYHPDGTNLFNEEVARESFGDELEEFFAAASGTLAVGLASYNPLFAMSFPVIATAMLKHQLISVGITQLALTGECPLWRTHSLDKEEQNV